MSSLRTWNLSLLIRQTSWPKWIMLAVVYFGTALILYSWLYIIREVYVIQSFRLAHQPPILSHQVRTFWDRIFAGLAVLIANNAALLFFFSKRRAAFTRHSYLLQKLKNDQIVLSGSFMFWFVKVGAMIGLATSSMLYFGTLRAFAFVFILLAIVLFLESWKTLSRLFRRFRFVYLFAHLIFTALFTIGLSHVKLIDHSKMDRLLLELNPEVDVPTLDYYDTKGWDRYSTIDFKIDWTQGENFELVTYDSKRLSPDKLMDQVLDERGSKREELIPFITVRFWVPSDFPYYLLDNMQRDLTLINQNSVGYIIDSADPAAKVDMNYTIKRRLPLITFTTQDSARAASALSRQIFTYKLPPPPPLYNMEFLEKEIKESGKHFRLLNGAYLFDGERLQVPQLSEAFGSIIKEKNIVVWEWDNASTFNDFIQFYAAYKAKAWQLRQQSSQVPFDRFAARYELSERQYDAMQESKILFPMKYIDVRLE